MMTKSFPSFLLHERVRLFPCFSKEGAYTIAVLQNQASQNLCLIERKFGDARADFLPAFICRKKHFDRASAWRGEETSLRIADYDAKVAAISLERRQKNELESLRTLRGDEPYALVNKILCLCRNFDVLPPVAELIDFDREEVKTLAPDTAEYLGGHPWLAEIMRGGATAGGRLVLGLTFVVAAKLAMFMKVQKLLTEGPDALERDKANAAAQLEVVRQVRAAQREMMARAQNLLDEGDELSAAA